MTLWDLGYPDQALRRSNEALALAQGLSHPHSLAFAQGYAGDLHVLRREAHAAQAAADSIVAISAEHGFTDFLPAAAGLRGWGLAQEGRTEEGISQVGQSLAAFRASGMELGRPYNLCLLAEVFMEAGRIDDGLSALIEAEASADQHEYRLLKSGICRLKGDLLLKQGDLKAEEARSCFQQAIEIARGQSAKSLELRAATRLARLLASQGHSDEARTMLAEIYNWFTEGFDTRDLKDAKTLLDQLNG